MTAGHDRVRNRVAGRPMVSEPVRGLGSARTIWLRCIG
jgi:hypothetical protein